ncbi:MAG TPA: hypothetical protein VHG92_08095 [Afifellaceae bacterium]|nr:hypothetical protein [Afifellaceae bacterium]
MTRPAATIAFVAGLMLVADGLVVWGMTAGGYPWAANVFPGLAALAITAFGLWVIVRPAAGLEEAEPLSLQGVLWLLALLPVLHLAGFRIGLPLYAFIYALTKRTGILVALALAAGVALLIEIMFVHVLRVPLEEGWIVERLF